MGNGRSALYAIAALAFVAAAPAGGASDARDASQIALSDAAAAGDIDRIAQLLNAGATLRPETWARTPPLVAAAASGHRAVVSLLLSSGARLEDSDSLGRTALIAAAIHGDQEIFAMLLRAGANRRAQDNALWTAEIHAMQHNRRSILDYVQALDEENARLTEKLHTAVRHRDIEGVRALMQRGLNPDVLRDKDFRNTAIPSTAMESASLQGSWDIAQLLLDSGAQVTGRSLMAAAAASSARDPIGQLKWMRVLFRAGADPRYVEPERDNNTALHAAALSQSDPSILIELINAGADINAVGALGWTPLMWAAYVLNRPAVEVLLAHGADATFRDHRRIDASQIAEHEGLARGGHNGASCGASTGYSGRGRVW